jgi:hypothetical protein
MPPPPTDCSLRTASLEALQGLMEEDERFIGLRFLRNEFEHMPRPCLAVFSACEEQFARLGVPYYKRDFSYDAHYPMPPISTNQQPLITQHGHKYFLPLGWSRFALNTLATSGQHYQEHWCHAYHGCSFETAGKILSSGSLLTREQCADVMTADGHVDNQDAIFLSPSSNYSGHPMYSKPWSDGELHFQIMFQVLLRPEALEDSATGGILFNTIRNPANEVTTQLWPSDLLIEPGIPDDVVEQWVYRSRDTQLVAVLMRVFNEHPVRHYESLAEARREAGNFVAPLHETPPNYRAPRNFGVSQPQYHGP